MAWPCLRVRGGCRFVVLLLVGSLLGSVAASPTSARVAPKRIVVGAVLDLSAGWTALGESSRVALGFAVRDANRALRRQGIRSRVSLRVIDAAGDPASAAEAVGRLAALGVRAIVGPQGSSEVVAARPVANMRRVLLVSQGSTAHLLATPADWVFRFVPDDVQETKAAAALIAHDGIVGVVPIWRQDAGNAGLADSIHAAVEETGGTVAEGVSYPTSEPDFESAVKTLSGQVSAMIATAGQSKVAVYLAGFDEVVDLLRLAAADPVLSSVRWYGSDGVALSPALVASSDAAAFAARVGYPNPTLGLDGAAARRSRGLRSQIEHRLSRPTDAFTLAAYDALRVAVDATITADAPGREALRRSFRRKANGYLGMSGRISLNAAGDRAFGSYDFFAVCPDRETYAWIRTWSYLVPTPGSGTLTPRSDCSPDRRGAS